MTLAEALSQDFEPLTRQRGLDYFRRGRVRIESASSSRVTATVHGTTDYSVELRLAGSELLPFCTCPQFDVDNCKHVWAVILAADERRVLRGAADGRNVHLGYEAVDFDDEETADAVPAARTHVGPDIDHAPPAAAPIGQAPPDKQGLQTSKPPDWRTQLARLDHTATVRPAAAEPWPAQRELLYVIDVNKLAGRGLMLQLFQREPKKNGDWGKPRACHLPRGALDRLPDANDRYILSFLAGATQLYADYGYNYYESTFPVRYHLVDPQPQLILPSICRTGRCRLRLKPDDPDEEWLPLTWEDADPWELRLEVRADDAERYELRGALWRGNERMALDAPLLITAEGVLFTRDRAVRFDHHGAFSWIALLREQGSLRVPAAQRDDLLEALLRRPTLPPLDLPPELRYDEVRHVPRPKLTVTKHPWQRERLRGSLSFDYGGTSVPYGTAGGAIVQRAERRLLLRDPAAEQAAMERLHELGWRNVQAHYSTSSEAPLELPANRLPRVVKELVAEDWHVDAEGKLYRSAGRFDINVSSGIDWFELHGTAKFGEQAAQLPELLAALRRGENVVRLGDGSFGVLPEEWLQRFGMLASLGVDQKDHVRFARNQVVLLDALIAAQPEIGSDEPFARAREELRRFEGVAAATPPAGFRGELRPYQREGLGWLHFLREFGFGGCLADDMGLGKTVQVLSMLEARRESRAAGGGAQPRRAKRGVRRSAPSLVVVPKSLIFNWKQEAARFAPLLAVLDYTGPLRRKEPGSFDGYDLVLTTYGTLRNDIVDLKNVRFDYVILDEAQAIKNADSAAAKAARLLQADHRLALSGTPIENHVGELFSVFEFLNPGMLGATAIFRTARAAADSLDETTRKLLARALRPLLLRRTKEQVVRELPAKIEQTLYCEMDAKQRKLYNELLDHYRDALSKRIARDGIARAKIQILEALLRLRQAAIHPGLIDERRAAEPSAKLDMLLHRVREVLDEGHKTLVFSQFTKMLAIVRTHLDRDGVVYEYLDGRTRDREGRVARFQNDDSCKLFLISLKAGGVGLNLTAAQYVFLLDPWWNPAVEAQAVDRAHRIGQTERVFAYRLITRNTIEEKVLELQSAKRDLADAIVGGDGSLIQRLTRDDLELLLA